MMGIIDVKPTASPAKFSGLPSASASTALLEHTLQQNELADQGRISVATTDAALGDQGRAMQIKADVGHLPAKIEVGRTTTKGEEWGGGKGWQEAFYAQKLSTAPWKLRKQNAET